MKIEFSPQLATLIAALIALVAGLVSSLVSSWLTRRREDHTDARQVRKEKVAVTRALYEEVITVMNAQIDNLGLGDAAFAERFHALKAKLALAPRRDIEALFYETGGLIDQWAANERSARPKPMGNGLVMLQSSNMTERYRVEADRLHPLMIEKFNQLKSAMTEDIAMIESSPLKRSKFLVR